MLPFLPPAAGAVAGAGAAALILRDVACVVKFFSMKMKHVPEASDIPSFSDAVGGAGREGVEHQLDVVAQVRGQGGEGGVHRVGFLELHCRKKRKSTSSLYATTHKPSVCHIFSSAGIAFFLPT